jgi:hypothetical protein
MPVNQCGFRVAFSLGNRHLAEKVAAFSTPLAHGRHDVGQQPPDLSCLPCVGALEVGKLELVSLRKQGSERNDAD